MNEREQIEQAIIIQESLRAALGNAVVDATIVALRQKLADLQPQPSAEQREQVTVLVADLSNFKAVFESLDAEEVKVLKDALWRRLDAGVTAHGGMIDRHTGDALLALWGAQTAHEDDPENAIRAALALQWELSEFARTNLKS